MRETKKELHWQKSEKYHSFFSLTKKDMVFLEITNLHSKIFHGIIWFFDDLTFLSNKSLQRKAMTTLVREIFDLPKSINHQKQQSVRSLTAWRRDLP